MAQVVQRACGVFPPLRYTKATWAMDQAIMLWVAWLEQSNWTRWLPQAPSDLNNSVILWLLVSLSDH